MAKITKETLLALNYLQNQKVAHLDFKPDNVLVYKVDGEFNVKIIDFGLCKEYNTTGGKVRSSCYGTPGYMAPEIFSKNFKPNTDIWALGMTILETLYWHPFCEEDCDDEETM